MEIIQTFTWEESEVFVISDGASLHLVDGGDLDTEGLSVGSKISSSEISDKYMEIPISILEEMNRRAQIYVEPDEEDSSEEENEDEEVEDNVPPPWQPLAIEKFLSEHLALREGERLTISVDVRIFDTFDADLVPDSEISGYSWGADIGGFIRQNTAYLAAREAVQNRMRILDSSIQEFVDEQRDLGHSIVKSHVYSLLETGLSNAQTIDDSSEAA